MAVLTDREQEFVDTYFRDVNTPPVRMLVKAFSLMLAALVLFSAAVYFTAGDITVHKLKWIMLPGMVLSTAAFIPGLMMFRRWRRLRELARLHAVFQKLSGRPEPAQE